MNEEDLLARIFPVLPRGSATLLGPGDDCAVVAFPDGRVAVSTDVLVEDHHFMREWSTATDVGFRAAMQNLADAAAMGATARALLVSLVLPSSTAASWAEDFSRGLAEACEGEDVGVVGGDLSLGSSIAAAVTVLADLEGREPVTRSGAKAGDVLAITGESGWSHAGLMALICSSGGPSLENADATRAADRYRRPRPPLAAGPQAAIAGAHAMIDVSDALLLDAAAIAKASHLKARIDLGSEYMDDAISALRPLARHLGCSEDEALAWVLIGGEDHALLAAFDPQTPLPDGWHKIGTFDERSQDAGPGGWFVLEGPGAQDIFPLIKEEPGWDHFRRRG
jgi:thiamine-monophosphate kinase